MGGPEPVSGGGRISQFFRPLTARAGKLGDRVVKRVSITRADFSRFIQSLMVSLGIKKAEPPKTPEATVKVSPQAGPAAKKTKKVAQPQIVPEAPERVAAKAAAKSRYDAHKQKYESGVNERQSESGVQGRKIDNVLWRVNKQLGKEDDVSFTVHAGYSQKARRVQDRIVLLEKKFEESNRPLQEKLAERDRLQREIPVIQRRIDDLRAEFEVARKEIEMKREPPLTEEMKRAFQSKIEKAVPEIDILTQQNGARKAALPHLNSEIRALERNVAKYDFGRVGGDFTTVKKLLSVQEKANIEALFGEYILYRAVGDFPDRVLDNPLAAYQGRDRFELIKDFTGEVEELGMFVPSDLLSRLQRG